MAVAQAPAAAGTVEATGDLHAVLDPLPIGIFAECSVDQLAGMDAALEVVGASLVPIGDVAAGPRPVPALLLGVAAIMRRSEDQLAELLAGTAPAPILLFPERREVAGDLAAALARLTGEGVQTGARDVVNSFRIEQHPQTGPLAGVRVDERIVRELTPFAPGPATQPVISCDGGAVVAVRNAADGRPVWMTAQPVLEGFRRGECLKYRIWGPRFLDLLPLLLFARDALGPSAWRSGPPRAALMIDDPNLRSRRYGHVDLEALADAGRQEDFHTIIAMTPLDAGKSRRAACHLMRRSADQLSLAMHGVWHTHHEFAQDVPVPDAVARLGAGTAWMQRHERRTGIPCPPVMTFPFGRASSAWLTAMRSAGLTAAIASPAFPFVEDPASVADATYELLPAEMSHQGFPILGRTFLHSRLDVLLFNAWLGRPNVVYLHHEDLAEGLEPIVEVARLLNRHVRPVWCGAQEMTDQNFQTADRHGTRAFRAFSNRISLPSEAGPTVVCKPRAYTRGEQAWLDDEALDAELHSEGLAAWLPPRPDSALVTFGPSLRPVTQQRRPRAPARARARRLATELRDQLAGRRPR